ncbi:uncharacterized protein [Musca autumnalis]|uniref:uncharacterized protein n=1 Tax=Musca autumnalis TaxID=221902 RepID=UPI003CF0D1AA
MPVTPLDLFIRATDAMVKFDTHFSVMRDEDIDEYDLEVRREEILKLWGKVQELFEKCLDYLMSAVDSKKEDIDSVDSKYDVSYQIYMRCFSSINRKLGKLSQSRKPTDSSVIEDSVVSNTGTDQHNLSSSTRTSREIGTQVNSEVPPPLERSLIDISEISAPFPMNEVHNLALPPCDTDVFEGNFHSWPTFRDLFTAVYIKNSRLSDIEKLCHLVRKTSGEAREIVSKFPLTHRSFDLAWDALKKIYDNKRVIVNSHLKVLFDLPTIERENSSSLKHLLRGINGCLSAMQVYDIPTNDWDPILTYHCIQRLPRTTVTLWEQNIKNKSSLSTWEELNTFLSERIQTLDCLQDIKGPESIHKLNSKQVKTHFTKSTVSSKMMCVLCPKLQHSLRECPKFKILSTDKRLSVVRKYGQCWNCLSTGHSVKECNSPHRCNICKGTHHTLIHRPKVLAQKTNVPQAPLETAQPQSTSQIVQSTSTGANRQVFHVSQNRNILLGTAIVNILHQGVSYPVRALIDPASEASFITERLLNRLKLPVRSAVTTVSGVNGVISATSRKNCFLSISSRLTPSLILETNALVLPQISERLPSFLISPELVCQLPPLCFADAHMFDRRHVDLLLGADLYPQILLDGTQQNVLGSLLAQNTVFGWILTGPMSIPPVHVFTTTVNCLAEDSLNKTLQRFWELEEIPKRKILSSSDRFCEDNYRTTTSRNGEGRYVVTLPFKSEFPRTLQLGTSRQNAFRQFCRNENALLKKPMVKAVYDDVIREYLHLNHMRPVPPLPQDTSNVCYLPHHPVINPDKKTTKLRVVFNASNQTSTGRILFRDSPQDPIQDYELQTVTFGVNCAPFLAIRSLHQLADDTESEFPLAAHILRKCMYVDDVMAGAHDLHTARAQRDQLISALSSAKFELRKWTSNNMSLLSRFSADELVDAQVLSFFECSSSKPLGIRWNAHSDVFFFCVDPIQKKVSYSKREVLSSIAKLFDPVGWLSPVIVVAKIIMQRVWLDHIEWDDPLPEAVHLEATSSLSTHNFLEAFQRFIARRGCPKALFSDNGTNFVGASRAVEKDYRNFMRDTRDRVSCSYGYQELSWNFIPAGAPHMGGLWEAAVRSFKIHFRKYAKNLKYTFEEFSTVLARIEACLNSRPLGPVNDNPHDMVALTPGHFLIGAPLLSPPEPLCDDGSISLINRYRKIQALTQQLCNRWRKEYLHNLQKRYKWKFPQRDLQVDDLVVVRHEQLPPTSWRLGRVVQVHPGDDGHVRVVDVRTEQDMEAPNELFPEVVLPDYDDDMMSDGELERELATDTSIPACINTPPVDVDTPKPSQATSGPLPRSVASKSRRPLCRPAAMTEMSDWWLARCSDRHHHPVDMWSDHEHHRLALFLSLTTVANGVLEVNVEKCSAQQALSQCCHNKNSIATLIPAKLPLTV